MFGIINKVFKKYSCIGLFGKGYNSNFPVSEFVSTTDVAIVVVVEASGQEVILLLSPKSNEVELVASCCHYAVNWDLHT